jgi:alpha-methylacyl-CoA racemase
MASNLPLDGITVIDFSTLLPGPLATLILARAGARVIKIERPPSGDEMRSFSPQWGSSSANFALLNAGKESVRMDLKDSRERARVKRLIQDADILVEQFRPGVMERLGLGFAVLSRQHPRLIYCSISGYGQSGPRRSTAGHDLNYLAVTGMLSLVCGAEGEPVMPPALVADIGGGSYPAVINILLALLQRERSGRGTHLDIAMAENLFPWMYWGLGSGFASGKWPAIGHELVTGGSPRYNLYKTQDDRYIAVAALEDRFWKRLCEMLDLPAGAVKELPDSESVRDLIAGKMAERPADEWHRLFELEDVCCAVVRDLEEAVGDKHFAERGVFERRVSDGEAAMPALPVPVVQALQRSGDESL